MTTSKFPQLKGKCCKLNQRKFKSRYGYLTYVCLSLFPPKFLNHDIHFSFSHWAFINKRLKERKSANPKSRSAKDDASVGNRRSGDKLYEILKKSFESEKRNVTDINEEEYFTEDDDCVEN